MSARPDSALFVRTEFNIADLWYADVKSKKHQIAVKTLNNLPEKVKKAVKLYAESRAADARSNGYDMARSDFDPNWCG